MIAGRTPANIKLLLVSLGIYFSCDKTRNAVPYTFAIDQGKTCHCLFILIVIAGEFLAVFCEQFETQRLDIGRLDAHGYSSDFSLLYAIRQDNNVVGDFNRVLTYQTDQPFMVRCPAIEDYLRHTVGTAGCNSPFHSADTRWLVCTVKFAALDEHIVEYAKGFAAEPDC
jgi:hypothetical protein